MSRRRRTAPAVLVASVVVALSGCAAEAAPRRQPVPLVRDVPPVLEGASYELARAALAARPSLVRIFNETQLLRPADQYFLGLLDGLLGILNPHPYWEWPYRVIGFPFYLLFGPFDLTESFGSAFFVAPDLLVTSAHVVDNSARIRVELVDGRRAEADIVAYDEARDLALLRVKRLEGAPPPALRLRRRPSALGEPLLALGFPARDTLTGFLGAPRVNEAELPPNPTVTAGIVASVDVELGNRATRYVGTDAALNPGNSGGPVIGLDGRVAGVATMIGVDKENEGYAVPASTVLEVFGELLPADGATEGAAGRGTDGNEQGPGD